MGYALQLTSLRYLGNFPDDIRTLPAIVITYVAQQLTIVDPVVVLDVYQRGETRWDHRKSIRETFTYHEFIEGVVVFPLVRLLYLRAWVSAERPSVLFETAKDWLMDQHVILPGLTILERLIARIRERVATRQWRQISQMIAPDQQQRLDRLLQAEQTGQPTPLDVLRQSPTRISARRSCRHKSGLSRFTRWGWM